jgi:hypothetical protein
MMIQSNFTKLFLLLLLAASVIQPASAQDDAEVSDESTESVGGGAKGFHIGFFVGGFFPNNDPAIVYDGYGYDANGNRKDFATSFMYQKIVTENNPDLGFTDRIGPELGVVNHEDWRFTEEDMPVNLKYKAGFMFGLAMHYGFDEKQAIIANLNFSKLRVLGNFTLETRNTYNQQLSQWTNNQFAIAGNEQRMMIQLGYSRILGNNEKANFFIEGGLCVNNAKVEKNFIQINSLEIDLTYFDQNIPGLANFYYEHYNGWGVGGFAGLGLNLTMNPKYTVQLIYNPSYESVNLGPENYAGLQHSIGLRAYYNL